jgi:hypothetical protein
VKVPHNQTEECFLHLSPREMSEFPKHYLLKKVLGDASFLLHGPRQHKLYIYLFRNKKYMDRFIF